MKKKTNAIVKTAFVCDFRLQISRFKEEKTISTLSTDCTGNNLLTDIREKEKSKKKIFARLAHQDGRRTDARAIALISHREITGREIVTSIVAAARGDESGGDIARID